MARVDELVTALLYFSYSQDFLENHIGVKTVEDLA
jgi:hypothetical protein